MTTKLYLESIEAGYAHRFDARVIGVDEDRVVLDRTLFYPLGGGQHWDTGVLAGPNGDLHVSEVRGRGDVHHSVGADHQLEVGDEVLHLPSQEGEAVKRWEELRGSLRVAGEGRRRGGGLGGGE